MKFTTVGEPDLRHPHSKTNELEDEAAADGPESNEWTSNGRPFRGVRGEPVEIEHGHRTTIIHFRLFCFFFHNCNLQYPKYNLSYLSTRRLNSYNHHNLRSSSNGIEIPCSQICYRVHLNQSVFGVAIVLCQLERGSGGAGINTPITIIAAGMAKWLDIYSGVLLVRVLLSWFPTIPWEKQPLSAIRDLCDPYLSLFRGIIPPIMNTLDISPLFAFAVLGSLSSLLRHSKSF